MNPTRSRAASAVRPTFVETLEDRRLMSVSWVQGATPAPASPAPSGVIAHPMRKAHMSTTTKLTGTPTSTVMGQTVTLSAKVVGANGVYPVGSTVLFYEGTSTVVASGTVSSRGYATARLNTAFAGTHNYGAYFGGSTYWLASQAPKLAKVTISLPALTTAGDGLKTATLIPSTQSTAGNGQTVSVNYTGYLNNGTVFDTSLKQGGSPLQFTLGGGQVIVGFDEGVSGMKVGETRLIVIPPNLGYGSQAVGSIPANSTLYFVVTLLSAQ